MGQVITKNMPSLESLVSLQHHFNHLPIAIANALLFHSHSHSHSNPSLLTTSTPPHGLWPISRVQQQTPAAPKLLTEPKPLAHPSAAHNPSAEPFPVCSVLPSPTPSPGPSSVQAAPLPWKRERIPGRWFLIINPALALVSSETPGLAV